ncbi:nucleotidyltransferase domain-containing protein [Natronorubrum tibetense]|uniref:DNA polymerase beta domain-containing protein region n=1 Tax=Natronorubrum tibetense GA33 TaxID=1114856 RepID=L9VQP1_9EURY|nr:nucleotidyltransferase domain-containing protein [Natronorubrum tibetense]ELY38543.1 DNA polymerase beta domain-containing protein region [Natronorubrum tibetense GA33]
MDSTSIQSGTSVRVSIPVPDDVFRHSACGPVLSLLADTPHAAFGIRDIGRAIERPHRSVSLAVDDLEALGLVTTRTEGGKKLVQIDRGRLETPTDPIIRIPQVEFHDPVRRLRSELLDRLENVTGILLFGSVARGEADRKSDIDCFVLVGANRATNQKHAHELVQELNDERFDGDRYDFQVLVESTESASRQRDQLREIVVDGITLYETQELIELKAEVISDGRE